jgi:hypothetical protein
MDKPVKLKKKVPKEQKERPAPAQTEPVADDAEPELKTFAELVRRSHSCGAFSCPLLSVGSDRRAV